MAIRSTHKGDRAQLGPRVDRVVYDAVAAHSGQYGGGGDSLIRDQCDGLIRDPPGLRRGVVTA